MINESATNPLQQALIATLRGNAPLQAWLHERPVAVPDAFARVYDEGTVPAELRGRWIAIADSSESWARWFMRTGSRIVATINLWHQPVDGDDVGKAVTYELWRLISRALSEPLPLPGEHTMLVGTAELLTVMRDPSESWHGIVRYAATTQRATTI